MDHEIGARFRGKLPEIAGDTARLKTKISGNALLFELRTELFRIPDRKKDPAPAAVSGKPQQEVATDESRGTSEEEFHLGKTAQAAAVRDFSKIP
jgi:hypothetical protein